MLEVRKLYIKKYSEDRELISNLSFTLNKGDKFAIIGLEGNGKSTLLKTILGYELDFVEVNGSIETKNNKLGYLPQSIKQDFENENVTTPVDVFKENQKMGLHTLFLLDLDPKNNKFMSVNQAIDYLFNNNNVYMLYASPRWCIQNDINLF